MEKSGLKSQNPESLAGMAIEAVVLEDITRSPEDGVCSCAQLKSNTQG